MSDGAGNSEQIRIIAEQLYAVWESKHSKRRASWPAWAGLILSVLGLAYAAGFTTNEIASAQSVGVENSRKIEELEKQASAIARIEAKVDVLMGERGR